MHYFADIMASAPMNLLAVTAAGAACGLYLFYRGFRILQRKRLILNTPQSKIRSASMGLVEINGVATGPYAINSPLKQISCYYYRSIAWQYQQRGKNSEWVKVAEESLHVPFYMDDGSGKMLVDPTGAEMDLHCDMHQEYNRSVLLSGPEMPGSVYTFLSRHGVDSSRRIKVEECCITPNNPLFVLGTLSQNPGLDASVVRSWAAQAVQKSTIDLAPASTPANQKMEIVQLSGESAAVSATEMTQQQKIAAALMKAGISKPGAWAAAGVSPQAAVRFGSSASSAIAVSPESPEGNGQETKANFDLHPPVVLMKGNHDPTFFISWRSQRDVIAILGWKSTLMIWGGPALTLVCIYILLAHFNLL
jgi:hypothetical protein